MPREEACGNKIMQPGEVGVVPLHQIEFVAAIRHSRSCRCAPRGDELAADGRQRVVRDIERTVRLDIRPGNVRVRFNPESRTASR